MFCHRIRVIDIGTSDAPCGHQLVMIANLVLVGETVHTSKFARQIKQADRASYLDDYPEIALQRSLTAPDTIEQYLKLEAWRC